MSIKVFQTNKAGKIEFTRCELEKLLNDTYKEGYNDGENNAKKDYWTWTSPYISTTNSPITYLDNSPTVSVDKLVCNDNSSTIGATNCTINSEELDKLAGKPDTKVSTVTLASAPIKKAYDIKNLNEDVASLSHVIDELLKGNFGIEMPVKNQTADAFTNLKKELNNL